MCQKHKAEFEAHKMQDRQSCPLCQRKGVTSYLNSYQINLDEAVLLCENKKCLYPVGLPTANDVSTFPRTLSEVSRSKDGNSNSQKDMSAQLSLQIQMAPFVQRTQTAALSTQTGSPLSSVEKWLPNSTAFAQQNHQAYSATSNGSRGSNSSITRKTPQFSSFKFGEHISVSKNDLNGLKLSKNGISLMENGLRNLNDNGDLILDKSSIRHSSNSNIPFSNDNCVHTVNNENFMNISDGVQSTKDQGHLVSGSFLNDHSNGHTEQREEIFPQWLNKDALCWLDVVLCLLVHNQMVRKTVNSGKVSQDSTIFKLVKAHEQVKTLLNRHKVSTPGENVDIECSDVSTRKNNPTSYHHKRETHQIVTQNGHTEQKNRGMAKDGGKDTDKERLSDMRRILDTAREEVWDSLKDRLKCEKGKQDSPVFALPLLLQQSPAVEKLFRMSYSFRFQCPKCKQTEENEYENTLPTFPSTCEEFSMTMPSHARSCFRCGCTEGVRTMRYKRLPSSVMMHFVDGLPSGAWSSLQFGFQGSVYVVTGMVQYIHSPDHFVAWLRNPTTNKWAKCDDLASLKCRFSVSEPDFPSEEVHIVMWEKLQSTHKPSRKNKGFAGLPINSVMNARTFEILQKPDSQTEDCSSCEKKTKKCEKCINFDIEENVPTHVENGHSLNGMVKTAQCSKNSIVNVNGASLQEVNSKLPSLVGNLGLQYSDTRAICHATTGVDTDRSEIQSRSSTPCSSLSSYSDTSVESTHLPMFTAITHETLCLVKPVPCKMDVLGLKTPGATAYSVKEEPCDKEDTISKLSSGKYSRSVSMLRTMNGSRVRRTSSTDSLKSCKMEKRVEIVPSSGKGLSAFQAAPKINGVLSSGTSMRTPVLENSSVKSDQMLAKASSTPVSIKATSPYTKASVHKTSSSSAITSKFKVPSALRKQASYMNLSRDGFRTLSVGTPNSNKSSPSAILTGSPSMGGNGTFLSTVKQYLISKTTGTGEQKSKFEGLNLKTAPHLKRSTNLAGLVLNSSASSSPAVSQLSHPLSKTTAEGFGSNSITSSGSRKRSLDSTRQKFVKQDLNIENNRHELSGGCSPGISKLAKIVQGSKVPGRQLKIDASHKVSVKTYSNLQDNFSQSRKENGGTELQVLKDSSQHALQKAVCPTEMKTGLQCESETVLQDLYEALNIPFKAVPDTMTDIMTDVSDILGLVDPCDPDSGQTGTGSETNLDWYVFP